MNITKSQYEELMEKFGCITVIQNERHITPVLIGDVLENMQVSEIDDEFHGNEFTLDRMLLTHWKKCGSSKSIQTIVEKSGWEEDKHEPCIACENNQAGVCDCYPEEDKLKSPEANELLSFLFNLKIK